MAETAYGEPFDVWMNKGSARPRQVQVRHLRPRGPGMGGGPIRLALPTILDGVEFLRQQIEDHTPLIQADLCVGINPPGLMIATILASRLRHGRRAIGFIPIGEDHAVRKEGVAIPDPDLDPVRSILVVDREVKTGRALRNVLECLRVYDFWDPHPRIAVLVAGDVTRVITHVQQLMEGAGGPSKLEEHHLPDFIAFTAPTNTQICLEAWTPGGHDADGCCLARSRTRRTE